MTGIAGCLSLERCLTSLNKNLEFMNFSSSITRTLTCAQLQVQKMGTGCHREIHQKTRWLPFCYSGTCEIAWVVTHARTTKPSHSQLVIQGTQDGHMLATLPVYTLLWDPCKMAHLPTYPYASPIPLLIRYSWRKRQMHSRQMHSRSSTSR